MNVSAQDIIQHAYQHPDHREQMPDPTHTCELENPMCGDVVRVYLHVDNDTITSAGFWGRGCALSQAGAELLMRRIKGRPLAAVHALQPKDILDELGLEELSPSRLRCAVLALHALHDAVGLDR